MPKAILLVIDSFGIGAMEDCEGPDCKANTYKHVREAVDFLDIPTLYKLRLGALNNGVEPHAFTYGFSALAHHGANTYLGHQEIDGSCPKRSNKRLMKDIHEGLADAMRDAGHRVDYPWSGKPVLLVDGECDVGDNLESSVGNIINLTADILKMSFDRLKEVGKIVRKHVDTSRVIAFGGP